MFKSKTKSFFAAAFLILLSNVIFFAQQPDKNSKNKQKVRTVTIPISIFSKQELKEKTPEEFLEAGDLSVKENGDDQTILSIRSVSETPLALAVLIQDDLNSVVNLELKDLSNFIKRLPKGSRVMVAYLRGGSVQVRQKFTDDLEKAANSLRILGGTSAVAPSNPYELVNDALERFDALPLGRRAVLLISDGYDSTTGSILTAPSQSLDLERAITKAQRRSTAIYSFYATGSLTERASSQVILNAQGGLDKLSEETGGRAFFSGTTTPVSFAPFFREVAMALNRQFVLSYLSTHMKKGYYRVQVKSSNPEIKIEHPKGYYYR